MGLFKNRTDRVAELSVRLHALAHEMNLIRLDKTDDEHPGTKKVGGYYVRVTKEATFSFAGAYVHGVFIRHKGCNDGRFVGMPELKALGVGYDMVMEDMKKTS